MATTALTKADEKQLQKHLENIDNAKQSYNTSVVTIGRELAAIKEILPDGEFVDFVAANCRYSKSTAYAYIQAHEQFGSFQRLEWIEPEAIYALSRCIPAATQAKKLANTGTHVTGDMATDLIKKSKAKKPPASPAPAAQAGATAAPAPAQTAASNGAAPTADPPKPADVPPAKELNDPNGVPIPKKFFPVFDAQSEFRGIVQQLGKVKSAIDELRKTPAGVFLAERFERIKVDLNNAQREVKFSMPHCVCPYCKGKGCTRTGADKTPCRQTGWTIKGVKGTDE